MSSAPPLHVDVPPVAAPRPHRSASAFRVPDEQQQHPFWFSPRNQSRDGWLSAVEESQFRDCERMLLLEDDLTAQGLGYSANFYASMLLVAMRAQRVLLEVPVNASWPSPQLANTTFHETNLHAAVAPRWCDRPPHTLQCFFRAWTHCAVPPLAKHVAPVPTWGKRVLPWFRLRSLPHEPAVLRVKLSWMYSSPLAWASAQSLARDDAVRFLLRPREWVSRLGRCVMGRDGLHPHSYLSVYVRDSAEKRQELLEHGHGLTGIDTYLGLAAAMLPLVVAASQRRSNMTVNPRARPSETANEHVERKSGSLAARDTFMARISNRPTWLFLQTSSEAALREFLRGGLPSAVSYTRNPRGDHDSWGGWLSQAPASNGSTTTEQGTIAAVNAYIGSLAAATVGPVHSAWTTLLMTLTEATPRASLCCGCRRRDQGNNMVVSVAKSTPFNLLRVLERHPRVLAHCSSVRAPAAH